MRLSVEKVYGGKFALPYDGTKPVAKKAWGKGRALAPPVTNYNSEMVEGFFDCFQPPPSLPLDGYIRRFALRMAHSLTAPKGLKKIALLGSTGSIGTQTLDVIAAFPDALSVSVLTAQNNAGLLVEQALRFLPNCVVIGEESRFEEVKEGLSGTQIEVMVGADALCQVVERYDVDLVVTALVGYAGLEPTLSALNGGKNVALANKETLVAGGALVMPLAKAKGLQVFPIDSEHSALYQCLVGEEMSSVSKLILTASGGPFRGKTRDELGSITKQAALKHPNWAMGAKITIDSATLMNKGLELIEAHWLYDVPASRMQVVVHPQSIIHSMVEYVDGSIKAQMGMPDMRLPIQYALLGGERLPNDFPRFNFMDYPSLTFEEPDLRTFGCLQLAFDCMEMGGTAACIANAANEVAVAAFLQEEIGFLGIESIVRETLTRIPNIPITDVDSLRGADAEARRVAKGLTVTFA